MARRILDIIMAGGGLVLLSLPLMIILFLVRRQDGHSPFYIADRAGKDGHPFRMVKIRSMVIHADKSGVESTSASDKRITPLGHFVRRWKIDELSQLWNVIKGDMSMVGPRPNTMNEVATYADWEKGLLAVRPGITDLSSIVFSDDGEILKNSGDPDADYTRLIRPWKGQLGLHYVDHAFLWLNLRLIAFTVIAVFNKKIALRGVHSILKSHGADENLLLLYLRERPLTNFVPGDLK